MGLAELGCNERLWNQIKNKGAKARVRSLIEEGAKENASRLITKLRLGVKNYSLPMPMGLAELGCDETLWKQIKNRNAKERVRRLIEEGNREWRVGIINSIPTTLFYVSISANY